jgi:hypothetical protein
MPALGFQVQERNGELVVTLGDFQAVYFKARELCWIV